MAFHLLVVTPLIVTTLSRFFSWIVWPINLFGAVFSECYALYTRCCVYKSNKVGLELCSSVCQESFWYAKFAYPVLKEDCGYYSCKYFVVGIALADFDSRSSVTMMYWLSLFDFGSGPSMSIAMNSSSSVVRNRSFRFRFSCLPATRAQFAVSGGFVHVLYIAS